MLSKILNLFVVFALSATINISNLEDGDAVYARSEDFLQSDTAITLFKDGHGTNVTEFPFSLSSFMEGSYNGVFEGTDKTFSLTIDNTAPTISVNVENNQIYKTADVNVTITGADEKKILLNNQEKGETFTVSENGNYELKITAKDKAGNEASKQVNFRIYNTPPVITVMGLDKTVKNTDYNITVETSSDFPLTTEIKLDGNTATSPMTVSQEGVHTLTVKATDSIGNESNYSKTFEIDKKAPVITVEGIDKASFNTDVHYKVTGADSVKLNGASAPFEDTLTEERSYILIATAEDAAGNITTVTKQFRIKKSAPEITITGIDKTEFNTDVHYKVTTSDADLTVKINDEEASAEGTISEEGSYILTARAEDDAGNYSVATKSFKIDKTKPVITIKDSNKDTDISNDSQNPDYYKTDVSYAVTFTDDSGTITKEEVMLDGMAAEKVATVKGEGVHSITATATDAAGNTSTKMAYFVIDRTPPVAEFNNLDYVNDLTKVVATASDKNLKATKLTAKHGEKIFTETGTTTVSLSKDDTTQAKNDKWMFEIEATDKAGNVTKVNKTVTRDTVAPSISLTKVKQYVNKNVDMKAVFTDANLDKSVMDINGKLYKGTNKIERRLTSEGKYEIVATSTDKAGNTSTKNTSFTLDKTAPVVSLNAPRGYHKSVSRVTARSNEQGKVYLRVDLDDKNIFFGEATSYDNFSKNGVYVVKAYAIDLAGNKSQEKTATFTVDNVAPKVSLSGAKQGAFYNRAVTLTATVDERFYKDTKVKITGRITKGGNISFPFTCRNESTSISKSFSTNGEYHVKITATDGAGNTATSEELSFTIDTKKPVITISVPEKGKYDSVIAPRIVIKDDNFQNKTITLTKPQGKTYKDNFNKTGGTRIYDNFKKLRKNDGIYTLTVRATDKAGNESIETKTFTVNRFGSTFKTISRPDDYSQKATKNVIYKETNISGIKSFKCVIVRDAEETKAEGVKVDNKEHTSTYTIPASNFEKEGVYKVRLETVDNAGNTSKYDGGFSFTIDRTPPVITYSGVEAKKTYKENYVRLYVSAQDTLSKKSNIQVTVNGRKANLETDKKGMYATIGSGYNQTIVITATDKAGNSSNVKLEKVSVSTNKLAFFVAHKALTVGIIAALALIGIVAVVLFRNKEDDEEDQGDDMVI